MAAQDFRLIDQHAAEVRLGEEQARLDALEQQGVVYFLQRSDGDVKIGCTIDLRSRRGALEREHGPLKLLGLMRGWKQAEAEAHERFGRWRRGRGEWFEPAPRLLRFAAGCRYRPDQAAHGPVLLAA